jgi:4-carboxymuconolactone decarboxylase
VTLRRSASGRRQSSLITVACLTTSGNTDQLVFHLDYARRNGNTEAELIEAITHLAFYAGWPKAMAARGHRQTGLHHPT